MKSLLVVPAALVAISLPLSRPVDLDQPLGEHDWMVDSSHSSVVFRVKHANAAFFKGSFDVVKGKVTLDPANLDDSSVELTIPMESIDTNDAKRDRHLKSPDFFNAKENPEITFTSTKVAKQGGQLKVAGNLSMAGKTKPITIDVEKTGEGEFHGKRVGFSSTFKIKRSEFGINYGVADGVLGDEVTLMIDLEVLQPK